MLRSSRVKRPTVAVVIPAFNCADVLGQAVQSALNQSWPPDEVVVVDDGSTDGSAEVAQSFGGRVRVLRLPNGGVARARNVGAQAASAELIAFLDGDDAFVPTRLEKLVGLLGASTAAFVWSDAWRWDGTTTTKRLIPKTKLKGIDLGLDAFLDDNLFSPHIVIRRSVFRGVGGFDESLRVSEDYEFYFRTLLAGHRYAYVDEPLYLYRHSSAGLSGGSFSIPLLESQFRISSQFLATATMLTRDQRRLVQYSIDRAAFWLRVAKIRQARAAGRLDLAAGQAAAAAWFLAKRFLRSPVRYASRVATLSSGPSS